MTFSFLQSAIAPCRFGTALESNPATYGSNVSSGSALLAFIQVNTPVPGSIVSVEDGSSNAFTKVIDFENGDEPLCILSMWMMATPSGDVGTKPVITATSSSPGSWAGGLLVQEVGGIQAAADGSAGSTYGQNGLPYSTGSATYSSTASGEYLVSYYCDMAQNGQTWTAPSGWTADPNSFNSSSNPNGGNIAVAYKSSTGGAETGSWSVTPTPVTTNWNLATVAFKLAAGLAPPNCPPGQPVNHPALIITNAGWRNAGHSL